MSYYTNLLAICIILITALGVTALGGRKPLKKEDLKSDQVLAAVKFATKEIRDAKLRNGELSECVQLVPKILRGSSQIVPGMKYDFEFKISPVAESGDTVCAGKLKNSVVQFKPEICEAEVWCYPWKTSDGMRMIRSTCLKIED